MSRYEYDAEQIQAALDENLIDFATTPNNCFRPDDPSDPGRTGKFCRRGLYPWAERNLGLSECIKEAQALGWIEPSSLELGRTVTRAESIEMTVRMYCEKRTSIVTVQPCEDSDRKKR